MMAAMSTRHLVQVEADGEEQHDRVIRSYNNHHNRRDGLPTWRRTLGSATRKGTNFWLMLVGGSRHR